MSVGVTLSLAFILFLVGTVGFAVRRNVIVALMCIEIMLNAANVAFVSLSRFHAQSATAAVSGQVGVFFVMVVAAAEAAVGLAIVISLFRLRESVDSRDASALKG